MIFKAEQLGKITYAYLLVVYPAKYTFSSKETLLPEYSDQKPTKGKALFPVLEGFWLKAVLYFLLYPFNIFLDS